MTADDGMEYICPECGEGIPADAKYCPSCDAVFDEGGEGVAAAAAPAAEEKADATREKERSPGGLSIIGLAFAILAAVALIGSVVLMNWDVWVSGASAESVGPRQRLFLIMGFVGFIVCLAVVGFDLLRRRK
jgi:hypothetical protein